MKAAEYSTWLLIGWLLLNIIASVLLIGEKRDPITRKNAVVSVLVYECSSWVHTSTC